MKKYFLVSAILGAIALICAALIALMNMVTSPVIANNNEKAVNDNYNVIFADCTYEDAAYTADSNGYITAKTAAKKNGAVVGYIYTVAGSNSYGSISLMVGIDTDNNVADVEFLTNTESFASNVNSHVKSSYPSSEESVVNLDPYGSNKSEKVGSLTAEAVEGIDTKCGATYGAKLVKALVQAALNEAKGA